MATQHALDYLDEKQPTAAPICVVFGDESFLKRLALERLRKSVLGEDNETPFATFEGKQVEWRDVADELSTVSLFGGGKSRYVVIDEADSFVTKFRDRLESYVERPARTGVLVLEVSSWASNTRLYKAIDKSGLQIECRPPEKARGKSLDTARVVRWLRQRSSSAHDAKLDEQAAGLLLELAGPEFGLLDQSLAKLALYAGPGGQVTPEMVRDMVGGWKTKTIWELVDAAADGDAAAALEQLHHLLDAGEAPQALFGQIAWSLRRFATTTRICQQDAMQRRPVRVRDALLKAGFRKWPPEALDRAEKQIQQLGRERAGAMLRWLLEADLSLKGSHSQDDRARFVLERLVLRMARELAPQRTRGKGANR